MPTNYREVGEHELAAALQSAKEADEQEFAPSTQNCLAEGTNHLLLAIYNELRHGHDQEAATLGNLKAAIETLSDRLGEGR